MVSSVVGLLCLLAFAISQGVRDAFFGNVFQSVSFLLVAVLAFGTSTVCFTAVVLLRRPLELTTLLESPAAFAALNVATAAAWLCFFYGLRHLEPAVVATLYNGVGPLTVLALHVLGSTAAKSSPSAAERLCYLGIVAALTALAFVVLTDRSGLSVTNPVIQGSALIAVVIGGVMITLGHMVARWFNDVGVGSVAVMGTRFLLTLLAAGIAEAMLGAAATRPPVASLAFLAVAAFVLIAVPSFTLQLGIARASPLAVNVFRSLGPVFVFAVQQLDGRLRFSGGTLVCIAVFCAFAVAASLLRGWSEVRALPPGS
jgi:drug/metabolite transporter (DMT)-like permease